MDDKKKVIERMLALMDLNNIPEHDYQSLLKIEGLLKQVILSTTDPDELKKWQEKYQLFRDVLDKIEKK